MVKAMPSFFILDAYVRLSVKYISIRIYNL